MAIFEGVKDSKGWPLGEDFFVRVVFSDHKGYKGWVENWDEATGLLSIRCERSGSLRPAQPDCCTGVKPTTLQTARRIGQGKTAAQFTKEAGSNRKIRSPRGGSVRN